MKRIVGGVVIIGLCTYLLCSLIGLWGTLNEQKAELRELEEIYATQKAEIAELHALLDSETDTQIIEKAARERLGYIYSNEKVFVDISGN